MLLLLVPLRATAMDDSDRAAIQSLIQNQIAAFQRDDGAAAYAMASPGIQDVFPTVEAFMNMVQQGYMPVYRPRSVTFGPLEDGPQGPLQKVFVTGPDGASYLATYALEREADGSWRISGCWLERNNAPSI